MGKIQYVWLGAIIALLVGACDQRTSSGDASSGGASPNGVATDDVRALIVERMNDPYGAAHVGYNAYIAGSPLRVPEAWQNRIVECADDRIAPMVRRVPESAQQYRMVVAGAGGQLTSSQLEYVQGFASQINYLINDCARELVPSGELETWGTIPPN